MSDTLALSNREQFCSVLAAGPLLRADAAVVLCGEDAGPRLDVAAQIVRSGGAPFVVLTGGKHDGIRWTGATSLAHKMYGMGIAPDHILIDDGPMNTREQAVSVVDTAIKESWARLLLIASPYHSPRAFLTFLKALQEWKAEEVIRLINLPASNVYWKDAPAGMTTTRLDLLPGEFQKIDQYADHVASYEDGLRYLAWWEGK